MKTIFQILTIAILVAASHSYIEFVQAHPSSRKPTFDVYINSVEFNVCSASTEPEQLLGINNPSCRDGAMFYFAEPQRYVFNMINVDYPLKLLTLSEDWQVLEVITMEPGQPEVVPGKPYKFALELKDLNADIKENDLVMYIDSKAH